MKLLSNNNKENDLLNNNEIKTNNRDNIHIALPTCLVLPIDIFF